MDLIAVVVVVVLVVVIALVLLNLRARSIVKRNAVKLSVVTGIPAEQISREIVRGNMTPGEWAERHGLHPMTFAPDTQLTDRIKATVTLEHPSEEVIVVSQGEVTSGGSGRVAIAVTDKGIHFESIVGSERWTYNDLNRIESRDWEEPGTVSFQGFGGEGFGVRLVDAAEVTAAINGQLERITVHSERVELTPSAGALFRWRPVGHEYMWLVEYDPDLLKWGEPTDEAKQAASAAVKRLNRHIQD